jgi:predicted nucleotidyltransferase
MAGAIVYGSRARGTHRPDSDADVAVLLRGEHQRFLTAKPLVKLKLMREHHAHH